MTGARHVIFGTGAIGLATLDALRRRGHHVRMINRSGHASVPADVEIIGGDARDPDFTTAAAHGATVLYQTLNPPYPQWTAQFPALQTGVLAAAQATGARLVSMENVYMYGRPAGHPLTEDRAHDAHTRKGRLRGQMAAELLAAHDAGRVQVAIGRASDYFGPRGGAQSNLGDRVFPAALAGKTATTLGDPDQPHTYTYIPDIGEGLAVLGEHPDAPGQVWHLPNDPDTRTTRAIVETIYRCAGRPRTKHRTIPPLLLRAIALTNPTVRELLEMQYQFDEPFIVDSSKIATKLGLTATPLDQAITDTLATYRHASTTATEPHPASLLTRCSPVRTRSSAEDHPGASSPTQDAHHARDRPIPDRRPRPPIMAGHCRPREGDARWRQQEARSRRRSPT
ncbi:NAD-dependent epimerase/dehydratase family protein [Actinomadura sp. 1N219]|uniref:NAD-dependent epimerase/dehydratase family protein n=1 Tax=Actinomadura sp. 1N219 TaxID=3375152 RepID=UPI0037B70074